jgi:hypothetical protein
MVLLELDFLLELTEFDFTGNQPVPVFFPVLAKLKSFL